MMKCVYEAPDGLEARMVADLIEQTGIACRVDGEFLQGGVGELFAGDFVRVLVAEDDFTAARAVVDTWQATQTSMPDVEHAKPIGITQSKLSLLIALVIGMAIGSGGIHSYYNTSETLGGADHNHDGVLDEKRTYLRGRISKIEFDNNFDGEMDDILHYSSRGKINYRETDLNYDGVMETYTKYRNDNPVLEKIDTNGDGIKDLYTYLKDRAIYKVEFYSSQTNALIKVQEFDDFKLVSSKFDSDGDGILDKVVSYDEYEEIKNH
jgi:hypothetical protein